MRLTAKEVLLLVPGVLLALGSLRAEDAFILIPCLIGSWICFILICIIHQGAWKWRTLTAVVITLGFGALGARFYYRPPRLLHLLTEEEHARFVGVLRSQPLPHELVRLGCPSGKEDECLLVSQFIDLFKDGDFEVEHDQVTRTQPGKPTAGLNLFVRADNAPDHVPAGKGVYIEHSPSAEAIRRAFESIGIKAAYQADGTMPKGTIGTYFGPDM